MNGQQGGDPAKLAAALVTITEMDTPPLRWVAGADAVAAVEQKARDLLAQVDAHRELSSNLADIDEDVLRAATDELTAAGHRAIGIPCDVADAVSLFGTPERARLRS
jgi:hypothetical protein